MKRSTAIERFLAETSTCTDAAPFAYFYCARNTAEPQRSDPAEVLPAVLKQLMCYKANSAREYRRRKQEADKDGSDIARLDIWETTNHIIKAAAEMPVTMFIDALDECRPDQRYQLLHALDMLLHDSIHLVKVLVSSREDADIVLKLKRSPNIYIKIDDNMHDIDRFVQAEIQKALIDGRLLKGRVSPQLQHLITKTLARKAKGMCVGRPGSANYID
jgi:cytochrome b involved in lipid metabolism